MDIRQNFENIQSFGCPIFSQLFWQDRGFAYVCCTHGLEVAGQGEQNYHKRLWCCALASQLLANRETTSLQRENLEFCFHCFFGRLRQSMVILFIVVLPDNYSLQSA